MDVEQHGARGVAHVRGVNPAFGEVPDEPAIHGAKGQFPGLGLGACAGYAVQQPFEFGAGEVGVQHQAGAAFYAVAQATRPQFGAERLGAVVLPDYGLVDGLAGFAVPDQGGFALVGDAQGADVLCMQPGLGECCAGGGELQAPDFSGVMLHPAGLRVELRQFFLRHGHGLALAVKDDAAATGGALVQGEDVSHVSGVRSEE